MPSAFLSYSHLDKPFATKLAADLERQGINCWIDESGVQIGDPLLSVLGRAIGEMTDFVVVLSPTSIQSSWVAKELEIALSREVRIRPVLYKPCTLPLSLIGRTYADFTNPRNYRDAFSQLVNGMGVVFNRRALDAGDPSENFGKVIGRAEAKFYPLLSKPFHRPFQYVGMRAEQLEEQLGASRNEGGNLVVESDDCRMYLEVEGAFVSYVEVDLKCTAPHEMARGFDSQAVLGAFSINAEQLELVRKRLDFHTYYDHLRKLKISVCCYEEGMPITAAFGAKYYGM